MGNIEVDNANSQKESFLIWSGINFKDFGVNLGRATSLENAIEIVENHKLADLGFQNENVIFSKKFVDKELPPKDEFETEVEFQKRKHRFELGETERKKLFKLRKKQAQEKYTNLREEKRLKISQKLKKFYNPILNSYLHEQQIEMKYNAEESLFDITVKNWLMSFDFQLQVPRNIAREFKNEVKNFEFLCHYSNEEKILKHKIRVGTKKVQVGVNKVQVGVNKIKIGTEIVKFGLIFAKEEPVYEEEPIYEETPIYKKEPIYEEQSRKEKKMEFRILEVRKIFRNQIFKAKIDFDILLEEMKAKLRQEYNNNSDFFR